MRKIFNHNLVPFVELERVMIEGQRYYVLPDGLTKLKSVTTILSERLDKTALIKWKKSVGEEEANRISALANARGTAVHAIAEKYVLNTESYEKGEMYPNIMSFKPIKDVLDEHVDNIMGIELPLYSKSLKCAGTTDLVAQYDGVLSVIDFKTSKKFKKEEWIEGYFLQSTLYSMMFEWTYKIKVPQIVIIVTVDHETEAQIFKLDRSKYVNRVLEVFNQ